MKKISLQIVKSFFILLFLLLIFLLGILQVPCPIKQLFGVPCPGCGMTRAWLSFLRLELAAAFAYHPLFWAVPVLFVYLVRDGRIFGKFVDKGLLVVLALAFFLVWVFRLV